MKKTIFLIAALFIYSNANAWSFIYPFKDIAKPSCRFSAWSELWSDCKMSMPRINWAEYSKYKDDKNLRKIYSILWWSTYNYWWDVWYWSHLWVDIATSAWTPVVSIWDWEVITAWWVNWWWNTVVIKHKTSDSKYIYSNYAHLSSISIKKWNIKAWEKIWEVWSTWNSYWNHLHFQIDITNQSHPYWYTKCSQWVDIMNVVNNWMCRDYLETNTIDPILFLESNWNFVSIEDIKQKQDKTIKIEQKNIKSREQILDEEIDEFLKTHTFDIDTNITWDNLEINKTYNIKLNVFQNWRPFDWILPWKWVEFEFDKSIWSVFPEAVMLIEKWSRSMTMKWIKNTQFNINIKLWKKVITTKKIYFYKSWDLDNPVNGIISMDDMKWIIWNQMNWALVFNTKNWNKQVGVPYKWTYILKATNWKAKLCNISKNINKSCKLNELSYELWFNYNDTKNWILIFRIVPLDYSPIKLTLKKSWAKYDMAWLKSDITVSNPKNMNSNYLYFNENISALKKGLIFLKEWYAIHDREFIWGMMKDLLMNKLIYEHLKSWDNFNRKKTVDKMITNFQDYTSVIDNNKKISRWEFAKILFDIFNLKISEDNKSLLLDEKWPYKEYMISLRVNYGFKWRDQFGQNYFQSEKILTLWEAIYMLENIDYIIK